jgi:Rad3-related DNA helicase
VKARGGAETHSTGRHTRQPSIGACDLDQLHQKLTALGIPSFAQQVGMAESERESFLAKFTNGTGSVGLEVMGGIFAEGIDLPGEQLVGVTVIGVGLPAFSIERACS